MKASTAQLREALRNNHELRAIPKLTAEWEHNRFSALVDPTEPEGTEDVYNPVTVEPAEPGDDLEWLSVFDLQSVALPNRPGTGIAKSRFDADGQLRVAGKYRNASYPSRFYLPTQDDPYKYWSSQQKTGIIDGGASGFAFEQPIAISVVYQQPVIANKIVVGFETSYSYPTNFRIEVSPNGTAWIDVTPSDLAIDEYGRSTIWLNFENRWVTSKQLFTPNTFDKDTYVPLMGVRLVVESMAHADSHLDVIQIGARLEADLSGYLEGYSRDFELSDRNMIAPLGGASSNTASVKLANMDVYVDPATGRTYSGLFNNDNPMSPFFGLIGKKVKFTCDLEYKLEDFDERIREFTMWSDSWGGQDDLTSGVTLKDSSVFLQEVSVPPVFWGSGPPVPVNKYAVYRDASGQYTVPEKMSNPTQQTVGSVIWQLMDILGFSNYNYTTTEQDRGQIIPYFWPEEDDTAWEQISELAEGTQTAVYFDEFDVLQIKPGSALFGGETIDYNLDAIRAGAKLADIEELSQEDDLVANEVEITYKPTKFSDFNNGLPKMETVWEPEEDTVVLRATALIRDLTPTSEVMWIGFNDAAFWPFGAVVNIRGEHLRYDAKEYAIRTSNGIEYVWCESQKDKLDADERSDVFLRFQNNWTGKLRIADRGLGGTQVAEHKVRNYNYTVMVRDQQGPKFFELSPSTAMKYQDGYMRLTQPDGVGPYDYVLANHETSVHTGTEYTRQNFTAGVRMRFPSGQRLSNKLALGGIWFGGNHAEAGYYLEISPTEFIQSENRNWRHELSLVVIGANRGRGTNLPGTNGDPKGHAANIFYDKWFDVDVIHAAANEFGAASIHVYIDGVLAGAWAPQQHHRVNWAEQGRVGVFTRYYTNVDYEYLYSFAHGVQDDYSPDGTNFLDLRRGGFTSGMAERDYRYGRNAGYNITPWSTIPGNPRLQQTFGYRFLEEFGPVVHEMREFDVKFDDDSIPTTHSFLYLSNSSQVVCPNYTATPFGAKFTLVNSSRTNAVIKGEDKVTFGSENSVDQSMFIYGRVLKQEDDQTVIESDKSSMRKNGVTTLEFDNKYLQSKEQAEALSKWVIKLWKGGVDEISVTIFGNPLLQIGDLVTINYPIKGMYPNTHRYFIVKIENEFDEGLETKLILRRARL